MKDLSNVMDGKGMSDEVKGRGVLCIASFNMHGFSTICDYLKKLLTSFDIILVQEHILREVDLTLLESCVSEFNAFMLHAQLHEGVAGRPADGFGKLVRSFFTCKS